MKTMRILSSAAVFAAVSTMPLTVALGAREARAEAYGEKLEQADELLQKRKFRAAARAYQLANELAGGSSVDAQLGLSMTYYHAGDYRDSVAAARRLVELSDETSVRTAGYNLLGLSLLELSEKDGTLLPEAEDAFRRVLELSDGQAFAAHYSLALALRGRGQLAAALAAARRFLSLAAEDGVADGARVVACDIRRALERQVTSDAAPGEDSRQAPGREGDDWEAGRAMVIEGNVIKPSMISAPQPSYADAARQAGIQGAVIVQAIVDREGCVTDTRVLEGLAGGLSEAAEQAVRRWVFRPARRKGEPVDVYYDLTINFRQEKGRVRSVGG